MILYKIYKILKVFIPKEHLIIGKENYLKDDSYFENNAMKFYIEGPEYWLDRAGINLEIINNMLDSNIEGVKFHGIEECCVGNTQYIDFAVNYNHRKYNIEIHTINKKIKVSRNKTRTMYLEKL